MLLIAPLHQRLGRDADQLRSLVISISSSGSTLATALIGGVATSVRTLFMVRLVIAEFDARENRR